MIKILELIPQLNEEATVTKFAELVGKDKSAISGHKSNGVLKGSSLLDWLHSYMDHLSNIAGGRGETSERLTEARINELETKAGLNRLNYYEKMATLVPVDVANDVLIDWAGYTNREINNAIEKLIAEIESQHKIEIDIELRQKSAGSVIKRIRDYALKLGEGLSPNSSGINTS